MSKKLTGKKIDTGRGVMTPQELETLGKQYYGRFWAKPLAEALGVNLRTVYAWRDGTNPITKQASGNLTLLEHRLKRRKKSHGKQAQP